MVEKKVEYYITLREREIEFTDEGLCITPSGKYIPHLLGLLHLEDRRGRATPSHHGLEVYNKENTMDEEYLNDKEAMTFRKRQVTVVVIIVGALLVYRLWRQLFIKRWN